MVSIGKNTAIKILAIAAFIITIVVALLFANYREFTFKNNWWQLFLIVISASGAIGALFIDKAKESTKFLGTIIVWALSLTYAVFICVGCFLNHSLEISFIVLAILLLTSTSLSLLMNLGILEKGKFCPECGSTNAE